MPTSPQSSVGPDLLPRGGQAVPMLPRHAAAVRGYRATVMRPRTTIGNAQIRIIFLKLEKKNILKISLLAIWYQMNTVALETEWKEELTGQVKHGPLKCSKDRNCMSVQSDVWLIWAELEYMLGCIFLIDYC